MLLMGKLTISMVIFNSYVKLPEGTNRKIPSFHRWEDNFFFFSEGNDQKGMEGCSFAPATGPAPAFEGGRMGFFSWRSSSSNHVGVSENRVPLNPMVNDHYPY